MPQVIRRKPKFEKPDVTRVCPSCQKEAPLTVEHWLFLLQSGTGGIQIRCRDCWKEYQRILHRKRKARLRIGGPKVRVKGKARADKKRYINSLKQPGCNICGYNKSLCALHFHHLHEKVIEFANIASVSFARLKEEAKKCIIVCANCHAEIHDGLITEKQLEDACLTYQTSLQVAV